MFDSNAGFEELVAAWPNKKGSDSARPLYDALVNGDEAPLCHANLIAAVTKDAASKFLTKSTLSSYLQRRHGAEVKPAQQKAGPHSRVRAEENAAWEFVDHCARLVWMSEDCDVGEWAEENGWDYKTGDLEVLLDAIKAEIEPWTAAAIERGDHRGKCGPVDDMAGCKCYVPWAAAAADWVTAGLGGCSGFVDPSGRILDALYSDRYCYWLATLPAATFDRIPRYDGRHKQPRIVDGLLVRGSEQSEED